MTFYREPSPIRLVPMCFLLSLLLLCVSEATGWFALLFFLPIALCMLPLCEERLYGWVILSDLLIAAIVLALPVPHYAWFAYLCILAPFIPVRHALCGIKKAYLATLLSIGITAVWTALAIYGLTFLSVNLLTRFSPQITVAIGLGCLLFLFVLDVSYQLLLKWYRNGLRRFLLPRA